MKLRLLWPLPKPMFHSPLNGHTLPAIVVLAEVLVLFAGRKNTRVIAGLVIAAKELEAALRRIVYIFLEGLGTRAPWLNRDALPVPRLALPCAKLAVDRLTEMSAVKMMNGVATVDLEVNIVEIANLGGGAMRTSLRPLPVEGMASVCKLSAGHACQQWRGLPCL